MYVILNNSNRNIVSWRTCIATAYPTSNVTLCAIDANPIFDDVSTVDTSN